MRVITASRFRYLYLFLLLILFSFAFTTVNAQQHTAATGGTGVSIATSSNAGTGHGAGSGAWTTLTGWVINENYIGGFEGDIGTGTYTFTLPAGWEFNTSAGSVSISRTDGHGTGSFRISGTTGPWTVTPTSTTLSFNVTAASGGAGDNRVTLSFSGIQVRPTGTTPLGSADITKTAGGYLGSGSNWGSLSSVTGPLNNFGFDAIGSQVISVAFPITITARDIFDNTVTGFVSTVTLTANGGNTITPSPTTAFSSGVLSGYSVTLTGSANPTQTITATNGSTGTSASFAVTAPPVVTVTANNGLWKNYGDITPPLTFTASIPGLTYTGSLALTTENVGSNPILIGTLQCPGYVISFVSNNFTIYGLPVTVTADPKTKVYGNVDPALTFVSSPAVGSLLPNGTPVSFTGAIARAAGENVSGSPYLINQNTLANPNYIITWVGANFTITQLPMSVTPNAASKTFGSADPAFTYTSSPTGTLPNGDAVSFTGALSHASHVVAAPYENVGTYAITQNTLANPNYTITFNSGPVLTVNPLPVSIQGNPLNTQTKVYGAVNPTYTYTATPNPTATGGSITGLLGRATGENVGTYDYNLGTLTAGSNYTLSMNATPGHFNITKLNITVTPNSGQQKTYGDLDPTLTYTTSPTGTLANGIVIALTGALTRDSGENVSSTYDINQGTVTNGNNPNYNITFVPTVNFAIVRLPVTVTPNSGQSKTFGSADPTFTWTSVPAQGSALPNGLNVNLTGSLQHASHDGSAPYENVGTYAITQGSLDGGNYQVTFTSGVLFTVNPLPVSVIPAANSKLYADPDPVPLTTYTLSPNIAGWPYFDAPSGAIGRVAGETLGDYDYTVGTLSSGSNYTLSIGGTNKFTILIHPVTITAVAGWDKIYGNPDPTFTFTTSVPGLSYTGGLSHASHNANVGLENAGTFNITQGDLAVSTYGYTITTFVSNTFVIHPKPITITVDPQTKVYGAADPTLSYVVTPSITGLAALVGTITRTAGESVAGSPYAINQNTLTTANNPNYVITYVGNSLTITKKDIQVAAVAKTKVYGNVDPALTWTTTPATLPFGDVLSGALTRVAGETVLGSPYQINQGTVNNANNPNYNITLYTAANLTITPKPITVTADAKSKNAGQVDPALTYVASPAIGSALPVGGTVSLTGSLTRVAGEAVGPYAIQQGTITNANNPNYSITYVGATFSINYGTITVTATPGQTKVYGSADPVFAYTVTPATPLTGTYVFSGALTRVPGELVNSPYAIQLGTLACQNYTIVFVSNAFTITPKPITVVANSGQTKVYGAVEPTLTYTATGMVGSDVLSGSMVRAAGNNVGTYAISQGSLGTANTNYIITFTGATFTITPLAVTVTPTAGQSKIVGQADPVLTYAVSPALVAGDAFTGALARAAGETAGTYAITLGTLALNTNYTITLASQVFTIANKGVTVTAVSGLKKTYGDADPIFTFVSSIPGVVYTGALGRTAGENVGYYAINIGTLAAAGYSITFVTAQFEIEARSVTITPTAGQKKFVGDADPVFAFTPTPALKTGDAFTGGLGRAAGETVATYAYTLNTLDAGTNYILTLAPGGTFAIVNRIAAPLASAATSITQTSFKANWTAVSGATGYFLDVSTSSTFETFVSGYENKNVGSVVYTTVTDLTEGTTYYYRVRAVDANGPSLSSDIVTVPPATTDVSFYELGIPTTYNLYQNYPNPFNPTTNIRFDLPSEGNVILKVYNVIGEEVTTLVNDFLRAGYHEVSFDASKLASGIYIYRIQSSKFVQVKKMLFVK